MLHKSLCSARPSSRLHFVLVVWRLFYFRFSRWSVKFHIWWISPVVGASRYATAKFTHSDVNSVSGFKYLTNNSVSQNSPMVPHGAIREETDPVSRKPRRRNMVVTCSYNKESTYSWNIQSVGQKNSRFAWTGASWNRWVMMLFLLFTPPSKRWLGWRETENRSGRFCDIYCTVILRYSFALGVISEILWSSCFESYARKDTR